MYNILFVKLNSTYVKTGCTIWPASARREQAARATEGRLGQESWEPAGWTGKRETRISAQHQGMSSLLVW